MADLPRYILEKDLVLQLSDVMQEVSLDLQRFGPPKTTAQGNEQVWKCSDKGGEVFSFTTLEVTDQNVFGLKSGSVYLELGPREKGARKRPRKELVAAFNQFDHALNKLGARRMSRD
jgi:hypothetical protein